MKRTALLADSSPLFLRSLDSLLASTDYDVHSTTSLDEAKNLICEGVIDLLIVDTDMKNGTSLDGLELISIAKNQSGDTRIISMSDDDEITSVVFDAGASAYVSKSADSDDILSAIRQVFHRTIYFPPPAPNTTDNENELTKRELEILRLTAEGLGNDAIARTLWVTTQTVKFHLTNIFRKLNVSNRTEASAYAYRNGLVSKHGTNGTNGTNGN